MKSIACRTALFLACLLAPPVWAAQTQTLALADLVNRPDRWPTSVKLKKDFQFSGGATLKAGQEAKVLEFNGAAVVLQGGELFFDASPNDCDLLEGANRAWALLTPEQRAIEPATLLKDASLWPDRVTCLTGFQLESGAELAPDGEYDFLTLDREGVKLYSPEHKATLQVDLSQTDSIARARQRVLIEPAKRQSRIAAALKNALVGSDGKPVTSAAIENANVYVLYFGASWCGPCRKFSPGLVKFMAEAAAKNPRLATVLMSNDKNQAKMLAYMKDEKMPWPAVPLEALQRTPLLISYAASGIPHLVVVDRHGLVLASSVQDGNYVGPDVPLKTLSKLLESGLAR